MGELILTTFDWVPEPPRGYVRDIRRALGAGRGRPALPRRERAVSRPQCRAFRAPAVRPGAVADRWRHLDLRERRDPAASRRTQPRADARRYRAAAARPSNGCSRRSTPSRWPACPGPCSSFPATPATRRPGNSLTGSSTSTASSTWSRCWPGANGWPAPSPSPTSSWPTCCALWTGSTGWRTIPRAATTSPAPPPARPS